MPVLEQIMRHMDQEQRNARDRERRRKHQRKHSDVVDPLIVHVMRAGGLRAIITLLLDAIDSDALRRETMRRIEVLTAGPTTPLPIEGIRNRLREVDGRRRCTDAEMLAILMETDDSGRLEAMYWQFVEGK